MNKETDITIQQLELKDIREFAKVAKLTYEETYPHYFSSAELENLFGDRYIQEILPSQLLNKQYLILVAKLSKKIIGYISLLFNESEIATLDKFYVLAKYKNRGYGLHLLQTAYAEVIQRNKIKIKVQVFDQNLKVISFYEKYGFIKTTETLPYYLPNQVFSGNYDHVLVCSDLHIK